MALFFRLQIALAIVSLLLPTIGWALVLLDLGDPLLMSNIASGGLVGCWFLMMLLPFAFPCGAPKQAVYTATIIFWGVITTVFPIIWDFTWALMNGVINGATAEDKWLWYWWTYSVADTRFLRSDPLMIIVEYWSGIMGFIEGYALYRFLQGDVRKAFNISLTVGCMQFYACTAFFGTEALVGFENIRPDFFSFYVKFWGLNGFWMIMPLLSTYCYLKVLADPSYDVKAVINQYLKKPS
jgi:hypothetical protein